MPLFFFHVLDDEMPDHVGTELADAPDARREALRTAGQILCDCEREIREGAPWGMRVTDDAGIVIYGLQVLATGV